MQSSSRISPLYKVLRRHPFPPSPKPTSPIPLKSLPQAPSQLAPNSIPSPNPNFSSPETSPFHPRTQLIGHQHSRGYSTDSNVDVNKEVDEINEKFVEAREEIDMAMESKETVYFNEEADCAKNAVNEVLDKFEALLAKLPDAQKAALNRSMGLKMEQLKAELKQLEEDE